MKDWSVHVVAPARLHLGFLDPSGRGERRFGGLGLAIDAPAIRLSIEAAGRDEIVGPETERIEGHLRTIRREFSIDRRYRIDVEEVIPAHAGLGSGTQLALALSGAVRRLEGLPLDMSADAALLGRGSRSGLGAAFMSGGGLLVDGGKGERDLPPPIVAAASLPPEWRIILVMERSAEGFHGDDEVNAFAALPDFPKDRTGEICRLVLMQALPALAENDIARFGTAIAPIQEMVGGHFAPAQGGLFTSPRVAEACGALAARGAHGIGQSSWGPTGFAFAENEVRARELIAAIEVTGLADGLDLRIAKGRDHGAIIERQDRACRAVG